MAGWALASFLAVVGVGVGVGAVSSPAAALPPMDFMHRAIMDQEGAYLMLWTPREKDIIFEVQVATRGYVGLGFSPNGGMGGADIIIGWVDDSNEVHLQDRHGLGNWLPPVDDSHDLVVMGGYQNDSHTALRFSRPWNTCDHLHDFQLSNDTTRVIWAYDFEDPTDAYSIGVHSRRGSKSLYLLEPRFSLPTFTDDVTSWTIHSPNVSVPEDLSTLYWCKLFKMPPLRRKTHIIGYQPVIEEKNRQHVHHMLLYECHLDDAHRHYEKWLDMRGTQCYSPNMPVSWMLCKTPLITWAIGSEGEMFPDHVGFPLGEDHGGADYFLLETHYDNPSYKKGIVDASGLRIFHTEKLRQYDAGMLTFGHGVSPNQIIPPAQRWKTIGHCSSECTRQGVPEGGVRVFQALLHAHLLGTDITFRHIREGRELPVLFKDLNYDFNYQQVRVLSEEVTVLPGDSFLTECGYDSRSKAKPVFGGFSTDEEMCLVFVSYYPRIQMDTCLSTVPMTAFLDTLGLHAYNARKGRRPSTMEIDEERESKLALKMRKADFSQKPSAFYLHEAFRHVVVKAPDSALNTTLYDILHDDSMWRDEELVTKLQEKFMYSPHQGHCETQRQQIKGVPDTFSYPDFLAIKGVEQACEGQSQESQGNAVDSEAYSVDSTPTGATTSPSSVTSEEAGAVTSGVGVESGGWESQDGGVVQVAHSSLLLLPCLLLLLSTLYLPHL